LRGWLGVEVGISPLPAESSEENEEEMMGSVEKYLSVKEP
jgi:hypothetical protein